MKNNKIFRRTIYLLIALAFLQGCANTKYLHDNQRLYIKGKVEIVEEGKISDENDMENKLEEVMYPEPNQAILGMFRLRLWFYNTIGETNKEGLLDFLKNRYGEKPVLLSDVNPESVSEIMKNRLFNNGHFRSTVDYKIETRSGNDQKAIVNYIATLYPAYTIDTIMLPDTTTRLKALIYKDKENISLKQGNPYQLSALIEERNRISDMLKEKGYYYFQPEYLVYKVDTNIEDTRVALKLDIKETVNEENLNPFTIKDISVSIKNRETDNRSGIDSFMIDSIKYTTTSHLFNPPFIINSIFMKEGELYSYTQHQRTLERLTRLGVFKFSNIVFSKTGGERNLLNVDIDLTPMEKRSLTAELAAVVKSTQFAGPALNISLLNRNLWGSAENLAINLNTGVETQYKGSAENYLGNLTYNIGIGGELTLNKFLVPFKLEEQGTKYLPQTKVNLSFDRTKRIRYYAMNEFNLMFGYSWNKIHNRKHQLNTIDFSYQLLTDTTPTFDQLLDSNSLLARSYESQFILSKNYNFTYFTARDKITDHRIFFRGDADISGSILYGIQSLVNENPPEQGRKFLGTVYSQYARFGTDLRYYFEIDNQNELASRIIIGVGVPMGNSDVLPLIKQYFAGGTSDIRAFQARDIGPGTFAGHGGNLFIDQSGDIKLEGNVEYRFDIFKKFEGATFVDAGNIWLYNYDPDRPGGHFDFDTFLNQLAVGTGFGVRYITNFVIVRLDLAFPLFVPYLPPHNRFTVTEDNFKDYFLDPVLNFSIGYPF
jgi:outer membrane protein assembly factor BamA